MQSKKGEKNKIEKFQFQKTNKSGKKNSKKC